MMAACACGWLVSLAGCGPAGDVSDAACLVASPTMGPTAPPGSPLAGSILRSPCPQLSNPHQVAAEAVRGSDDRTVYVRFVAAPIGDACDQLQRIDVQEDNSEIDLSVYLGDAPGANQGGRRVCSSVAARGVAMVRLASPVAQRRVVVRNPSS